MNKKSKTPKDLQLHHHFFSVANMEADIFPMQYEVLNVFI